MDNPNYVKLTSEDLVRLELRSLKNGESVRRYGRMIASILSVLPWVGSALGAGAALHGEIEQGKSNQLFELWLEEHRRMLAELAADIDFIVNKIDEVKVDAQKRIESEEYLSLVRQSFKNWDRASTREKREYIRSLLATAATTSMCNDDIIRLFNDWIALYHEAHFRVIQVIYKKSGSTRAEIWDSISETRPREDSADADLYRMLIRDLSTGGVIRQARETDAGGNFMKRKASRPAAPTRTMESAFDDEKPYVLTALGEQFVHYVMNEITTRIK